MLEKNLVAKARAFDTKNIEHPDKKRSKSTGEVLTVTLYSDDKFKTEFTSSDIITYGSGKDVLRWVKADLTDAEISAIKEAKGDSTMRKIMKESLSLAKRITNAAKNSGVAMDAERKATVNDFVRVHLVAALDQFMGAAQDEDIKLPF